MNQTQRKYLSVTWAWAAGWLLVSIGQQIWGVNNLPNQGLAPLFILGFGGWAIGAVFTIRYMRQRFDADVRVTALRSVGWGAGALVAVLLGWYLAQSWDAGFLGLLVAPAIGALIGGALTLPVQFPASWSTVVRASLRGAFSWGLSFLVFEFLSFYLSYFFSTLMENLLAPSLGEIWASIIGWGLPAAAGGYAAALVALFGSKLLRIRER
jgi:hypothetical protein